MIPHNCTSHVYELRESIRCAARLVESARPSRQHQEPMIAHGSRYWPRAQILKEVANAR